MSDRRATGNGKARTAPPATKGVAKPAPPAVTNRGKALPPPVSVSAPQMNVKHVLQTAANHIGTELAKKGRGSATPAENMVVGIAPIDPRT